MMTNDVAKQYFVDKVETLEKSLQGTPMIRVETGCPYTVFYRNPEKPEEVALIASHYHISHPSHPMVRFWEGDG